VSWKCRLNKISKGQGPHNKSHKGKQLGKVVQEGTKYPLGRAHPRGKEKPKRPQNGFISRGIECAQTQLSQITRSGVD